MKTCGVYRILCLSTGRSYIGGSIRCEDRMRNQKALLRRRIAKSPNLQQEWDEYGEINFVFQIIEVCTPDVLRDREAFWIKNTKSRLNSSDEVVWHNFNNAGRKGRKWNRDEYLKRGLMPPP